MCLVLRINFNLGLLQMKPLTNGDKYSFKKLRHAVIKTRFDRFFYLFIYFYVMLTVHLSIFIPLFNQLDAQKFVL